MMKKMDEQLMKMVDEMNVKRIPYLKIDRVPENTFKWFREFANKEFCDDYGMALKFLCDFFSGIITTGTEPLEIRLDMLEDEIKLLKLKFNEQKEPSKENIIRMANGRTINK
jgi:hypothetical protein